MIPGVTFVNYAANAQLPASSVASQQFQYWLTTWKGTTGNMYAGAGWYVNGDTYLDISGDYYAGSGGWTGQNDGNDTIHNQVLFAAGWASANAVIPYLQGFPGSYITAPDSIGEGVGFNAHATTDDPNAVPPMSYAWTVNGSPISGGGADVSLNGPSGSAMTIGVTTTDGNSVQYTASHTVAACSNNQITC
jgi:hypothetical protein